MSNHLDMQQNNQKARSTWGVQTSTNAYRAHIVSSRG